MIYLIAIYCVLFAILAWRRIDWALALVVFALPTYLIRFQVWFAPMTLLEAMILILFAVWLIKRITEKGEKISFGGYGWLILIFLLAATAAVYISSERFAALGIWKAYFIESIMFFVVLINTVRRREDWDLIIWALGFSAIVIALPAIFQKFTGFGITTLSWFSEETRRVTSWYGYPNAIGLYLGPIVVLFFGLLWLQITNHYECYKLFFYRKIVFNLIVVAVSLSAIIFAKSEGAWLGVLVGIVFLGLFYPNKKFRVATFVLIISFISSILFFPVPRAYVIEKLTMSDLSGQIRVQQWKETLNMLKDGRLLFGAGLAGYQTAVAPHHQEGIWIKDKNDSKWLDKILDDEEYRKGHWQPTEIYLYPHNFFLNFWSEIGLIGLLTVLAIMIKFVLGYWELKDAEIRKQNLVLLAVILAIFVHGLVDVPYFKNDLSVFWWLIVGLSASLIASSTKVIVSSSNK